MQSGYISSNGADIYYEMAGEGTPLVLLHAGIADSRMWDDQFEAFAQHYQVIRYDMRGFGKSHPAPGTYSRHEDLRAVLRHLGIERAYLLGCSMGGTVVIDFSLLYPEQVLGLIIVTSNPRGYEPPEEYEPPQWQETLAAFEAGDLERTSALEVEIWVDGHSRIPDKVHPDIRNKVYEMNLIALKNEVKGLGEEVKPTTDATNRLSEIQVPTLIIVGDLDDPDIVSAGQHMATNIQQAQLVIIENTAHMPNMEKPALFNETVLRFLEAHT